MRRITTKHKIMENEETVIVDSEEWFVSWQQGNKLYVKHKVGKQDGMHANLAFGEGVDTNSRQFKSAIEIMKAMILSNEETLEEPEND